VDRCNGLVNAGNYAARGFESVDEVRQATLGEPLQVDQVGLDALRGFNEQTNPETLLVDIRRNLYPVKVGARVAGAGDFVVHVPR
jgi:hypothetical protein